VTSTGPASTGSQSLDVPAGIETPSLVIDLDILDHNLAEMAGLAAAAGVELWPHAKTHRTLEYARRQLAAGAAGLTVSRMEEAEAFAAGGAGNLLLAYPLTGDTKLNRARLLSRRANLTVGTDSLAAARAVGEHFAAYGEQAAVVLIINTGADRCGVTPAEAVPMAREIARIDGVRLTGIMTHEASTYSATDEADLRQRCQTVGELMTATAGQIRAIGLPLETVSMGASASARGVVGTPGVTQLRPGIYAFNDVAQLRLGNATPQTCAARVVATVISHAAPDRALIDAGSKSLSQDAPPGQGPVAEPEYGLLADLPGWQLFRLSEEHGWLRWRGPGEPTPLRVGQLVQVIPNHVCSAFWNIGVSTGIRGGEAEGTWRIIDRNR
jgi:D-serine deaminase-like pyridoxal phosphate-dependent protein